MVATLVYQPALGLRGVAARRILVDDGDQEIGGTAISRIALHSSTDRHVGAPASTAHPLAETPKLP